jgi:RNA polymerase sigma-70 factor (ECF subfamily)
LSARPTHNQKELLFLVAQGDENAFTVLFDHYSPKVMHTAFLFTQSLSRSEDIVQDVFTKLWLKRAQLREVEDFEKWIFIITRNMSLNILNRIARAELGLEKFAEHVPAREAGESIYLEAKDMEKLIRNSLAALTDQQKKVFELSTFKGLNREEIAQELGLSPNTIKMHLLRATKYVRVYLRKQLYFLVLLLWIFFV